MTDALTLFEFWTTGHAPNFVRLIAEAWGKHDIGHLRVVVPQRFCEQHQFVFDGFENLPGNPVRWVALDDVDEAALNAFQAYAAGTGPNTIRRSIGNWWKKYGRRFPLENLDLYPLALSGGRPAPVDFSGILHLPRFYYRPVNTDVPHRPSVANALEERLMLRLLNHPQFRTAFFLDLDVANSLKGKGTPRH
jgi:hypothetical protein